MLEEQQIIRASQFHGRVVPSLEIHRRSHREDSPAMDREARSEAEKTQGNFKGQRFLKEAVWKTMDWRKLERRGLGESNLPSNTSMIYLNNIHTHTHTQSPSLSRASSFLFPHFKIYFAPPSSETQNLNQGFPCLTKNVSYIQFSLRVIEFLESRTWGFTFDGVVATGKEGEDLVRPRFSQK